MWWRNNPSLRSKPKLIDAIELLPPSVGEPPTAGDPDTGERSRWRQACPSLSKSGALGSRKARERRFAPLDSRAGKTTPPVAQWSRRILSAEGFAGPDLPGGNGGRGGRDRPRTCGLRVGDRPTRLRLRVARHVGSCWAAVGYSCRVFTAFDRQSFVSRCFEEF